MLLVSKQNGVLMLEITLFILLLMFGLLAVVLVVNALAKMIDLLTEWLK